MKKIVVLLFSAFFILAVSSCKRKKYTEVVEVPLPSVAEKLTLGSPEDAKAEPGAFEITKLPFGYDALAPNIDAQTMEIHYSKQYVTFTNNLNKALVGTESENIPIVDIFKKLDVSNTDLKNNLGGYYNHTLYFDNLTPKGNGKPTDTLASSIDKDFGSFEDLKTQFKEAANKQFGSGWTWLVVDKTGKLQITSTQNQDNPLMPRAEVTGTPILALDLWEHAYYLNYQNNRKKYIDNFFNIINWKKVSEKYEEAINN
jgi:Fe-Mn family superoxide dismutase